MKIGINEYLKYVIANKFINKRKWVTTVIGIHEEGYVNEYAKIEKGVNYVKVDDGYREFTPSDTSRGILSTKDVIKLSKESLVCLDKDIETTLGLLLINYVLIDKPFQGKIPYIMHSVKLGNILDLVKDALSNDIITVGMYKDFVTSCTYLESFNKVVTPSTTANLMVPPPGLTKYKEELNKEFVTKYGTDWSSDATRVVAYDNKLKSFYADYIDTDASSGIIANNKNKGNALSKKYLTFSSTNAFGEQVHIDESLNDGYPKDPEKLAAMFNTIRHASYSRGAETQKGGSVAKSVLRATSSIKVLPIDCGVKYGKTTIITEERGANLIGRYAIVNAKLVKLDKDTLPKYINKEVMLRSPMYCKATRPNYCKICMGDKAGSHENGVALIVTNISAILTITALKAMHNTQMSSVHASLDEMLF